MLDTNSIKGINVQQAIIACPYVVYIPVHVRLISGLGYLGTLPLF